MSIFNVHPFDGIHKTIKKFFDRQKTGTTVLDHSVIRPKIMPVPEIMDDAILDIFNNIFHFGKRIPIKKNILENTANHLVSCHKCNIQYSSFRKICPVCSSFHTIQIQYHIHSGLKPDPTDCIARKISGNACMVFIRSNYLVIQEKNRIIIHHPKKETQNISFSEKFSCVDLVMEKYIVFTNEEISITNIQNGKIVHNMISDRSMNIQVASDGKNIYRILGENLMKGSITSERYHEKPLVNIPKNRTRIWSARNGIVTMSYLGTRTIFTFISNEYFFSIDDQEFHEKVHILDIDIATSDSHILIARKIIDNNTTYISWHIFTLKGNIVAKNKEKYTESNFFKNISGKTMIGKIIVHPTDSGIVLQGSENIIKQKTEPYTSSNSQLFPWNNGIVSWDGNNVYHITMKGKTDDKP
jgi:hypothetical protein